MIDRVLTTVISLLNDHIGQNQPEVVLGNLSKLDGSAEDLTLPVSDRVILSVVNIQQDDTLRNMPANRQVFDQDGLPRGVARHPGVFLNVFLLIGANKINYPTGLLRIAQIIGFFQKTPLLTEDQLPGLSQMGLEKIHFDLYSTTFEELNQLWGIMGSRYLPSVVYKMRMAYVDSFEEDVEISLVRTIDSRFGYKKP